MPDESTSSKHRRHDDNDAQTDSKKRHRHRDDDDDGDRKHKHSSSSSKKHKHSSRNDEGESSKHRHHRSSKHSSKKDETGPSGLTVVDDGNDDEDMWVEKDLTVGGERDPAAEIPTGASLSLKSNVSAPVSASTALPTSTTTESKLKRDDWMLLDSEPVDVELITPEPSSSAQRARRMQMDEDASLTEEYGEPSEAKRTMGGGVDFFSSLGTERKKTRLEKPDPVKSLGTSSMELNPFYNKSLLPSSSSSAAPAPSTPSKPAFGGPGSQWRMKKLQRTYETAEEEGRDIEDVARDRYDSFEDFEEAKAEKRWIDDRDARRSGGRGGGGSGRSNADASGSQSGRAPLPEGRNMDVDTPSPSAGGGGEKRWMFTDSANPDSRPSSRASFRRPGAASNDSTPSTPQPSTSNRSFDPSASTTTSMTNKRIDALRPATGRQSFTGTPTGASSPVPSALVPTALLARKSSTNSLSGSGSGSAPTRRRALSPSSLNNLQAKVLKAKLMNAPDAAELEKQFDEERKRAVEGGGDEEAENGGDKIEMVPTIDAQGRLYDVGHGRNEPSEDVRPGNRRKKDKYVETRDRKTGELVRINADDDTLSLGDMLRHERSGAGMQDQQNMDAELARAITTDGKFEDDLEYMDDNAEKLGRKKMRTDAMKRQFAINDFTRSQKAMASCQFCFGENDEPPKAGVIAMGSRVYLSCTLNEELTEGHCYIVPIQHHFCMLEADDDAFDEVKNFMKCLIRMAADQNKGVIFYETVLNLKWQKHTFIECLPVPLDIFDELPAYFQESILASEVEWSQHKKLIDFSKRPGGFRRAMVKNLPYFMVQWDYKGEKGYGHVIEGVGDSAAAGDDSGAQVDEGDRGGGEFPRWFAAEIVGNLLDVEPRRWRRPRKIDLRQNKDRVSKFNRSYAKYDWTGMIGKRS